MRAKFRCDEITNTAYGSKAILSAVHSATGENADFATATPAGLLNISISKDVPAATFFVPGAAYYLDFVLAPTQV